MTFASHEESVVIAGARTLFDDVIIRFLATKILIGPNGSMIENKTSESAIIKIQCRRELYVYRLESCSVKNFKKSNVSLRDFKLFRKTNISVKKDSRTNAFQSNRTLVKMLGDSFHSCNFNHMRAVNFKGRVHAIRSTSPTVRPSEK